MNYVEPICECSGPISNPYGKRECVLCRSSIPDDKLIIVDDMILGVKGRDEKAALREITLHALKVHTYGISFWDNLVNFYWYGFFKWTKLL